MSICAEHPFFVTFSIALFGDGISPFLSIPFTIVLHTVITASAMIVLNVVLPFDVVFVVHFLPRIFPSIVGWLANGSCPGSYHSHRFKDDEHDEMVGG